MPSVVLTGTLMKPRVVKLEVSRGPPKFCVSASEPGTSGGSNESDSGGSTVPTWAAVCCGSDARALVSTGKCYQEA